MSRWDLRTGTAGRALARTIKHSPRTLSRLVGRALGMSSPLGGRVRTFRGMEPLEQRQLLEGSFGAPTVIALDGDGAGLSAGAITPSNATTDNDYYSFVMPGASNTSSFVSVLADTRNEVPNPSDLDTKVTIFAETDLVNPIVTGVINANANVVTGVNNGTLTTGLARDGWGGFVGTGGVRYFVIVSSDSSVSAPVAGTYTLRVKAGAQDVAVNADTGVVTDIANPPVPDPQPPAAIVSDITLFQQDKVYKYVAPTGAAFKSVVTVNAQVTQANPALRLNTRLDIYKQSDATGRVTRVSFDSDAGRLNDGFATFLAEAGATYWVRVRSDITVEAQETPLRGAGTGSFFLVMDGRADEFPNPMNPVTRLASDPAGTFFAFDPPAVAPDPAVPDPVFQTASYRFIAQGTGLAIITGVGAGLDPVGNSALRVFDDAGTLIAYNDNFSGTNSQLKIQIESGREYYVVIDGFEVNNGTQYGVFVESNHTFDPNPASTVDDHINPPDDLDSDDPAVREANRRLMEQATPMVWTDPFLTFDDDGNIVRDRGLRVGAVGTGRIEGAGDEDVFQFTAPADMLGSYAGDNDDAGVSLFAGGRFELADPFGNYPTLSRGVASYDGGDWWYTGDQRIDGDGVQLGFTGNTAASGRAEIYTMLEWDPTPDEDPTDGTTDHVLVVGGDFRLVIPGDDGPVGMTNLALWGWNAQARKFQWGAFTGPAGGNLFDVNNNGLPDDAVGGTNAPVRALTIFDPEAFDSNGNVADGEVEDPGANWLVIAGDYTNIGGLAANRISFIDDALTINAIGTGITGANASVRSLAVYDPDDAGDERAANAPLVLVPDSPDHPSMLYVGGSFTTAGGIASANLAVWSGQRNGASSATAVTIGLWNTPNIGSSNTGTKPAWAINGAVNAMVVMEVPDIDGDGDFVGGERLIVAGEFTTIGGTATSTVVGGQYNRIAMFGRPAADTEPNMDPAVNVFNPRLVWDALEAGVGTGAAGTEPIHALTVWDPADSDLGEIAPVLVVGGAFDTAGGAAARALALWQPIDGGSLGWTGLADDFVNLDGTPGVVRSLTALTDPQEPQIPLTEAIGGTDPQEVLYIAGEFGAVVLPNGPILTNGLVGFALDQNIPGFTFFTLGQSAGGGVGNADPDDLTAPAIFSLATYDEVNPFRWDHHDRPAQRMSITVAPNFGGFENAFIELYDSNFELVYSNETINPQGPDPSGAIDQSLTDPSAMPNPEWIIDAEIWGGETYYLVVRDSGGGGTGRYNVTMTADAPPPPDEDLGLPNDINANVAVEVREGNFATSTTLFTALASGDANLTIGSATQPPPLRGRTTRTQITLPSINTVVTMVGDQGNISSIDDTDLWNFRAEFTGTVEIRVGTRDINDEFGELFTDVATGDTTFTGLKKQYQSALDSAIRVFDNDFNQIGYNNDNYAVQGELTQNVIVGQNIGPVPGDVDAADNTADFYRRDGRIVINVVAGNFYYIQVESGQRFVDGSPEEFADRELNVDREIDWRRVMGSYQLYLNQMPNIATDLENGQTVLDDYLPNPTAAFNPLFAAPISLNDDQASSANGSGSISGIVNNTPNNPQDFDDFTFIANGTGTSRISVTRTGTGNNLNAQLIIFDLDNPNGTPTNGAPAGTGVVAATVDLVVGRRYGVRVGSNGGTEGAYRVDVTPISGATGAKVRDDFADRANFWNAADIPLLDFQGSGSINGNIEVSGDTDVFRFSVTDFAVFTVTVTPVSPTFNPYVDIYEISETPLGQPIALRIGTNDDFNPSGASRVTVPITPNRIIDVPDPGEDRVYPFYYVVVRGSDVQGDLGQYTVTLNFPATDDHPDAPLNDDNITRDTSQYALASTISIDTLTGQGVENGEIELDGDTDLFSFTAVASGSATVTINRPDTSLIRTRVVILADGAPGSTSVTLASGLAPDDDADGEATINFNVTRGVRYLILVEGFGPPNVETEKVGAYTVNVQVPPVDDFPNATEWNIAAAIGLSNTTGGGQIGGNEFGDSNATISPENDSDLFKITTIANGTYTFTVNTFAETGDGFAARIRIYDATHTLIDTVTAGSAGQQITSTINGTTVGSTFFILVDAVNAITPNVGEYRLVVNGGIPGGGGGGPDPSVVDFNNPTVISLDERTGNGQASDVIEIANDRDLFSFTTFNFSGPGDVFIQVVTPNGSLLDATIQVLSSPNELPTSTVVFDADGIPGATANAGFLAQPGTQYWIIVDGVGTTTGTYTIRISTRPGENFLFFPEGWANDSVNSQVAITNPNNVDATFTILARYETGDFETVLATGTIEANGSLRQVISGPASIRPAGLRTDTPFSLVIVSDVAVGATFTHTDFGGSLGEAFTETVTPTWNFARVERSPGGALDFVLFYNPNGFDVDVTLTAYQTGRSPVSITTKVGALRRGGLAINDLPSFPTGVFSVVLTSEASDSAFDSSFQGVVASLSHYDLVQSAAFASLGDQGSTAQVVSSFSQGNNTTSDLTLFNPGTSATTVTITGSYITAGLPTLTRTYNLQPKTQLNIKGSDLGLITDQHIGLRFRSSSNISVLATQTQKGEQDSTATAADAGTRFFFGDAFINTVGAGNTFFQTLNIHNPSSLAIDVRVNLLFADGTTSTITIAGIAARGFSELRLHERPEIVTNHTGDVLFAIDATSTSPFVATLTGYDLTRDSGWTIAGKPFGLTNPIARI